MSEGKVIERFTFTSIPLKSYRGSAPAWTTSQAGLATFRRFYAVWYEMDGWLSCPYHHRLNPILSMLVYQPLFLLLMFPSNTQPHIMTHVSNICNSETSMII